MSNIRFLKIWVMALLLIPMASCGDDDEPQQPADTGQEWQPSEPPAECDRTLLIYMAADNNLGYQNNAFDQKDMDEMLEAAGDLPRGSRVILYHDGAYADPELLELQPSGWVHLRDYPGNESGLRATSPERMAEVFADMRTVAPARAYGLVLWSHGTGWDEEATSRAQSMRRSFGKDYRGGEDRTGTTMSIPTLAGALQGQGFDFVYFDCCHMASVEVAYELRHCVDYIVASATQLPAAGMPYHRNLPMLAAATPDLAGAAASTFAYYDAMSGRSRWCSMTVVDCRRLDELASATRAAMATATATPARADVQHFTTYSPCRLFDFGDYVEKSLPADDAALARWHTAMDQAVVYRASTPCIYEDGLESHKIVMSHHSGLSTYVLECAADALNAGYSRLQWWQDVASQYTVAQE